MTDIGFDRINGRKFWFPELWWSHRSPGVILAWIAKWSSKTFRTSSDDWNTPSLGRFLTDSEAMPETVQNRMQHGLQALNHLGFGMPVFFASDDLDHMTSRYLAASADAGGRAVGQIHERLWKARRPPKDKLFTTFVSESQTGQFIVTTSAKPDMPVPQVVDLARKVDASVGDLWAFHQQRIDGKALVKVDGFADAAELSERLHSAIYAFHTKRGVFVPLTDAERAASQSASDQQRLLTEQEFPDVATIAEMNRLQNNQTGWVTGVVVLIVSLLLFLGQHASSSSGSSAESWSTIALLMAVLFVHESGHFLAMRLFGYRNVKMFFIPGFGAAVTGKHFNVPGWKKALVSLAGPVPGIFIGAILGVIGIILKNSLLTKAALLSLTLNGINLLPLLPLDGGWVMHAILFSRHYFLDGAFRVAASLLLILLTLRFQDRVLMYVAIAVLINAPVAFKQARLAHRLRKEGVSSKSADDQAIPPQTAQQIITAAKADSTRTRSVRQIAQGALAVFETLNAQPPGVLASLGLAVLYIGSFIAAILFAIFIAVLQNPLFLERLRHPHFPEPPALKHTITLGQIADPQEQLASRGEEKRNTIVGTFPPGAGVDAAYQKWAAEPPAGAIAERLGDSILLSVPSGNDEARRNALADLKDLSAETQVDSADAHVTLTITATAISADDAKATAGELEQLFLVLPEQLIAPWHRPAAMTDEQYASLKSARQTFEKLDRMGNEVYTQPEYQSTFKQMATARRDGDTTEIERLKNVQKQLLEQAKQVDLQTLRASPSADPEVIKRFLAEPPATGTAYPDLNSRHKRLVASISPLLGKVADDDAKWAASFGYVFQKDQAVRITLSFNDFAAGAPEFVRWLISRGFTQVRYEVGPPMSDEERNEE